MFSKDDMLTTDKYLSLASENILYLKTDLLTYGIEEMGFRGSIISAKPANVWITGHSDYCINYDLFQKYEGNCKFWFTVNKNFETERLISLPLGIPNNNPEIPLFFGNIEIMLEIMEKPRMLKNLVYMNFSINTCTVEREGCYQYFNDKEWVSKGTNLQSLEGRRSFLEDIRNHKFVLCPRGNGIDTHRLWEALYMGSIPIVKNHISYTEFHDLPILFVNEWTDITEVFLENKYKEINERSWNMDKLKFSYWKERILNASL